MDTEAQPMNGWPVGLGFFTLWMVLVSAPYPVVADGFDDVPICPWPFDPLLLMGAPLGQYHCPYCGSMIVAGMPHMSYEGL